MIDTTVIAAYAAQYAKACRVEPRTGFDSNQTDPCSYMLLDDLSPFLGDDDTLKETIKDFGFELHRYEDGRMVIYLVPGHTPGGEHMSNCTPYCGRIEFKESKKANEANIRNAVYAARTLVTRYGECKELLSSIYKTFSGKPKPSGSLVEYIANHVNWIDKYKTKYADFLMNFDGSNVVTEQVLDGIRVLEGVRSNSGIWMPLTEIDPASFRHCIENVLNLCSDVDHAYLTSDSCAIAVAIFIEDYYSSEYIKDSLKVPAIFEVMNALAK